MTLCPECVQFADNEMIEDRLLYAGVPDDEDNRWAENYNTNHKAHTKAEK